MEIYTPEIPMAMLSIMTQGDNRMASGICPDVIPDYDTNDIINEMLKHINK